MTYFVTGATGFIGRHLLEHLLARKGDIHCLVRKASQKKFDELREHFGADGKRLVAVVGDVTKPMLGLTPTQRKALVGKVKHFFHLAAIYDLAADADSQIAANVEGTRHALELAAALKAGCFHYASSIAVAGLFPGVFREDMFGEAENLDHPYFRTKHDAEALVRAAKIKHRIYRPAIVLGSSKTGEIDKIDGPYYFFRALKKLREALPAWMPTIGLE
ncbi:MAG: SDR family oxidoreductase, partial [Rudaea sp.]